MKTKSNKTKVCIFFFSILFDLNSFSQAPNWTWETNAIGNSYDGADATTTDTDGNVYVTGYFYGSTVDFGTYTLTNINVNKSDMFIVKYDAAGTVLWAESAGGNDEDGGYSVATDASNNVYITGYFFSPSITFGSTTLINQGSYDMFIVKYDPNGSVLWAKSGGKVSDDYGRAVITDSFNNVYVAGSFQSSGINFGSTILTNTDITETTHDLFIVKYDSAGTVLWAKSYGGTNDEYARALANDSLGNLYFIGNFNSPTLAFDSITLANVGSYDMFIVKCDTAGVVLWANSAGGTGNDYGNSTATDPFGNVYIIGGFASPTITIDTTTLTNSGIYNIYLAKCNSAGTFLWAKKAGGIGTDDGYDISTDGSGNIYVTGYFSSPTLIFGSTTLTNLGGSDIFIAKYDTSGTIFWAKSAGDFDEDKGLSVVTFASNVYIARRFRSTSIDFASTLYNAGGDDMFLAKIGESGIGIAETSNSSNISIFPNPFSLQTTIVFSEIQTDITLKIIDVLGKEIKTINYTGKQITIEKGEMNKGIYFIQISNKGKNIINKKIIVQ